MSSTYIWPITRSTITISKINPILRLENIPSFGCAAISATRQAAPRPESQLVSFQAFFLLTSRESQKRDKNGHSPSLLSFQGSEETAELLCSPGMTAKAILVDAVREESMTSTDKVCCSLHRALRFLTCCSGALNRPIDIFCGGAGLRLVGGYFRSCREDQKLNRTPICFSVGALLLAHA
jgi:hypothetical protein